MTDFEDTADRYRLNDVVSYCITTNAFVSEGTRTMSGGASVCASDPEALVRDAMMLTPAQDVWDERSAKDDNTLAAFAVLARLLENDGAPELRGGRGAIFMASHFALMAITVAAAFVQ